MNEPIKDFMVNDDAVFEKIGILAMFADKYPEVMISLVDYYEKIFNVRFRSRSNLSRIICMYAGMIVYDKDCPIEDMKKVLIGRMTIDQFIESMVSAMYISAHS